MSDFELLPTRQGPLELLGEIDDSALTADPMLTVRSCSGIEPVSNTVSVETLREQASEAATRIRRLGELGRGGMGVVHLAEQRSLGRTVAVKELRDDTRGEQSDRALLLEAWILGALEHPNVVPVHDLMLDAEGHPLVVLKRIEGESWQALLKDEGRVRELYGVTDVLEWHLGVLVQVSNAVSFAHSRGIVHRDLKPENVMVGRFGEVYLVDWGVAVATVDDGTGRFPLAREVTGFAGTPTYMAPEMLGGRDARITERTDVYLLGATLFHVLTGRPPHRGRSLLEIATNLAVQELTLPSHVPAALADVCRKAMRASPEDRYESAEAFRLAVQEYLRHRPAELLVTQGQKTLDEMRALAPDVGDDAEAHRAEMFGLYSEARLGFRLARRTWPNHEVAARGLVEASEIMIRYLLSQGDVASASTLATQVEGELPEDIVTRLAAAKDADRTQRRRQAELAALEKEFDPAIGRRARFGAYGLLTVQFLLVQVVGMFYRPLETHAGLITSTAIVTALLVVTGVALGKRLTPTRLNRQLYAFLELIFFGKLLVHIVIAILGRDPSDGHVLAGVIYGTLGAAAAVAYLKALWPIAISFLVACVLSAVWPDRSYAFYASAAGFMLAALVWLYRREVRDEREDRPRGVRQL